MKTIKFGSFILSLSFIFSLSISNEGFSQTYNFSYTQNKTEVWTSIGANLSIRIYDHFRPVEILDEFEDIDQSGLWGVDRLALSQNSSHAASLSDKLLYASVATPFLLAFDNSNDDKFGELLLMGIEGFLFQDGLNAAFKIGAERPRPYVYQSGVSILNQEITKNDTKSFYSGHTATSAYFCFYSAQVFSELYPDSKWKPVVWGLASIVPAATGYLRFKAGRHFPTDVFTGYVVGAGFGLLFPKIYQSENLNIGVGANAMQLSLNF